MSEPAIGAMSDDEVLDYTLQTRLRIVNHLTKKEIPSDTKELSILLSTLDGMDRAALAKKKIQSEEQTANRLADGMTTVVADVLSQARKLMIARNQGEARTIPTLDANLPRPTLVEGETAALPLNESYESFQARMAQESTN